MDSIFEISGYRTSQDYSALAELMQRQSVICIVDYDSDLRDVAKTVWSPSRDGAGNWQISSRGIGYVHAFSKEDFIRQCEAAHVDVMMPHAAPVGALPMNPGFFWWRATQSDEWRMVQLINFAGKGEPLFLCAYDVETDKWSGRTLSRWGIHDPVGEWIECHKPSP